MSARFANAGQPLDEALDQLALQQDTVSSGVLDRVVELRRVVACQGDQAERRVMTAKVSDCRDAVEQRHVEVDHDGVGIEIVGLLDGLESVLGETDNA
jgi:hypothetical protein